MKARLLRVASRHMEAPKVQAKELPSQWTDNKWGADTWLRPCYRRLGMGNTHAAFLLMAINAQAYHTVAATLWHHTQFTLLNDEATRGREVVDGGHEALGDGVLWETRRVGWFGREEKGKRMRRRRPSSSRMER